MSSYSNQDSSNRSRGGRNRSRRRGPNNRNSSSTRSDEPRSRERVTHTPKKKSLWQKILSFFGGNSVPAPKATSHTTAPKRTESAAPAKRTPQSVRRPEPIEVTSPRVYVGNLSFDATESDLLELFSGVGSVQNAEIVFNKDTHRSKGFGFIQMASMEEASRAVSELHDKEYMGRKLVVSGAKAVQESRQPRNTGPSSETSSEEQSPSAA